MFALSYSAPTQPDPDQRDRYFAGQATGFAQMAEVAEDRNKKRQINIQQQEMNLARQQEARIARDQALARQLQARQIDIAEREAPIVAMQKMLSLQKTQAEINSVNSSLRSEANNNNFDQNLMSSFNQIRQPNSRNFDVTNQSRMATQPREEEKATRGTSQQTVEDLTRPTTIETSRSKQITEQPVGTESTYTITNAVLKSIENRDKFEELSEEAKKGESKMLSTPIQLSLQSPRGFGAYNNFEGETDFTQYIR